MRVESTGRGFRIVNHDTYENEPQPKRLIQESSAIGDYEDSMIEPGSSFLWFGDDHHLNREEVDAVVGLMSHWLEHGRLPLAE